MTPPRSLTTPPPGGVSAGPPDGTRNEPVLGILLMVVGVGVLTVNDVFVRLAVQDFALGQSLFVRALFSIGFLFVYLAARRRLSELAWQNPRDQIVCGIYLTASVALFIYSLKTLPISTATVLIYVSPLIVTALAPLVLLERVGWRRYAAVSVGFIGVVAVIRPGATAFEPAMAAALCAAAIIALRDMLTRRMTRSESSVSIFMASTMISCLVFMPWGLINWTPVPPKTLIYLAVSGLAFTIAQITITESFRRADASLASPFKYAGVLFAGVLGYAVWGEVPDRFVLLGAFMIVGSGLFIVYRERRLALERADVSVGR